MFLANAGSMIFVWIVALLIISLFLLFLKLVKKLPESVSNFLKKFKALAIWSGILRIGIATYLEVCVSVFLQIRVFSMGTKTKEASSILAIMIGLLCIVFPIFVFLKVFKNRKELEKLKIRFGSLFDEFKTVKFI